MTRFDLFFAHLFFALKALLVREDHIWFVVHASGPGARELACRQLEAAQEALVGDGLTNCKRSRNVRETETRQTDDD